MDVVNGSLEEKMTTGRDYDRVIQEAEQVVGFCVTPILLQTICGRHTLRFWSRLKCC